LGLGAWALFVWDLVAGDERDLPVRGFSVEFIAAIFIARRIRSSSLA
jgi:hypothetical protein